MNTPLFGSQNLPNGWQLPDRVPYFSNHERRERFPWSLYHGELATRLANALQCLVTARASESPLRVLVVGCGLEPFVPGVRGVQWYGADLDPASIAECQRQIPELKDHFAVCEDAFTLPHNPHFQQPFDAIVAKEVIEHVREPERWARRLTEHLGSRGQLLLTTPNYGAFSTLNLLESTVLEWIARRDGYSRRDIHPSRFDLARLAALPLGESVSLCEASRTALGWALYARWEKAESGGTGATT